jgi:hypothetical protein
MSGDLLDDSLAYSRVILGSIRRIADCCTRLRPLAACIQPNDEQSRAIAAIRDALVPKLLSGEIRVKDAEKMADAAL